MNRKDILLEKKEKLLKEIEKIDAELSKPKPETIKVINFRGATTSAGKGISDYEVFDVLWKLDEQEYKDLMDSNEYTIFSIFFRIVENHGTEKLNDLDIVFDLFNLYKVRYFSKDKYSFRYPCELNVRFGYKLFDNFVDWVDVGLKVLEVPVEVYENFENVCVASYSLNSN